MYFSRHSQYIIYPLPIGPFKITLSLPLPTNLGQRELRYSGLSHSEIGNFLPTFLDPLKMRPIGCPEMSVRNYHYSLHNDPEECSSHLLHLQTSEMTDNQTN